MECCNGHVKSQKYAMNLATLIYAFLALGSDARITCLMQGWIHARFKFRAKSGSGASFKENNGKQNKSEVWKSEEVHNSSQLHILKYQV